MLSLNNNYKLKENVKKLLLFLLSLTLVFTPACKHNHKRAALISTGSVLTAASVPAAVYTGLFTSIFLTGSSASASFCQVMAAIVCFPLAIGTGVATGALLIAGIPLLVVGSKMKKESLAVKIPTSTLQTENLSLQD